jgi:murein DD-endopeptidase MepM/ murein hydrolase activator NlpD
MVKLSFYQQVSFKKLQMVKLKYIFVLITSLIVVSGCSKMGGPASLFKKTSPHEAYAQSLESAGLHQTVLGRSWLAEANESITKALPVTVPYKETGFFAPEKVQSTTLRFEAKRGKKIRIQLQKTPAVNFRVYVDLFQQVENKTPERIAFADTAGVSLEHEIDNAGLYYLRLQPELLSGGQYTLTITAGPSLSFPVSSSGKPRIGSFWGDARDEGARKHEGVDIFAPRGTPALAAADGTVTNVTENKLGGNVVFMRPADKDYTLYYAHLQQQLVTGGQTVRIGDTIGLVGNTGNAINTVPHLHFGIYTGGGAIDAQPFIDGSEKAPKAITASLTLLNGTAIAKSRTPVFNEPVNSKKPLLTLPANTAMQINAATNGWYKITLPDGQYAYIESRDVAKASGFKQIKIKADQQLLDRPGATAVSKALIAAGSSLNVLGLYKNYYLVNDNGLSGWIVAD